MAPTKFKPHYNFFCNFLILNNLPRMDSNHDKVIQSHLHSRAPFRFFAVEPGCLAMGARMQLRSVSNDRIWPCKNLRVMRGKVDSLGVSS